MAERTNPHSEIVVGAQDKATPVFDKIKGSAQGMANAVEKSAQNAARRSKASAMARNLRPARSTTPPSPSSSPSSVQRPR